MYWEVYEMSISEALRHRILQLCVEHNLTIGGLCTQCGIAPSTLNNLIGGRNRSVNAITLARICEGLEIPLSQFFDSDLFSALDLE
jgi:DNA-binding Xre family transcriptional regulator